MDFREIKIEAKDALVGKRLIFLLFILVAGILAGIPVLGILVSPMLMAGIFVIGKDLLKGKEIQIEPMFTYIKEFEHGLKILLVNLLVGLIVFIGLILFIVPGIIFALRYSQAMHIMSENKDMYIMDALKKSRQMMHGYKTNLFIFGLSFIGHYLLAMITFGIYLLYAMPYITLAMHNYYIHLKKVQGIEKLPIEVELA